jgi:hypothetical protein
VPIRKRVVLDPSLCLLAAIWGCCSGAGNVSGLIRDQDAFFT